MAKKTKTDDAAALRQLKQDLRAGQLGSLYVLHGPEAYLRQRYLGAIRRKLIDGPAEAFNYHHFTAENLTLDDFQNAVEAIPMMAEASMVQVDDVDPYKLPQADRERLVLLLEDLPEFCHVFFVYDTLEYKPDKRMKKLYGAFSANGREVCFARQSERDLTSWLTKEFSAAQRQISPDLCRYLILRTGGDMATLSGEILKISAYAREPVITKADIDAVVEPVLEAYVFDMTDAVAAGKYETALQTLQTLLRMQQEPILLLGAIGAQMRRIYCAHQLQAAGKGADSLMRLCGIGSYPAQKTMEFARRLPAPVCKKALLACAETDYALKTSYDDAQRLLELLLLQLAQEARPC